MTDPDCVVIDLTAAHIWDVSSVAAIETKHKQRGRTVEADVARTGFCAKRNRDGNERRGP